MPTVDTKLTLAQAAKLTPGRPHASTLFRWATRGQDGVRLQVWNYGRRLFTTMEAVERFARDAAAARSQHSTRAATPVQRAAQRVKRVANAERDLHRHRI